jgi:hypothetical protein
MEFSIDIIKYVNKNMTYGIFFQINFYNTEIQLIGSSVQVMGTFFLQTWDIL